MYAGLIVMSHWKSQRINEEHVHICMWGKNFTNQLCIYKKKYMEFKNWFTDLIQLITQFTY